MNTKYKQQTIKDSTQSKISLKNKPTKKYDVVSTKIRKILSTTAQTFIPELAEALKQDWFPTMPEKELQKNKGIRDAMRRRIFDDWSSDKSFAHSKDNIWGDSIIHHNLPYYLKNPSEKLKAAATTNLKIGYEKRISERQKQNIKQIAESLPDEIITEPEEQQSELTDEEMHDLGITPYTEAGKSIRQLTGDIVGNSLRLFATLVNNDTYPNSRSDILVDYIKPSREFRRGLMLELDRNKRAEIYNYLQFVIMAAQDTIEIIHKIDEAEKN